MISTAPSSADLDALRARYRAERDRRLRPDGVDQYQPAAGDFANYADDPWTEDPRAGRAPCTDEVDAVVLGAGFGGLVAAARLRDAGLERVRIVDRAGDVGGTWYWNRYPGIACDVESYIYLPLLEEVGGMPSRRYAPGEEIRRHAQALAERFDLYRDALFGTEVTSIDWDDDRRRWRVRTDHGDDTGARFVVVCGGPFARPKLPSVPGIGDFAGHTFHTSRWDYAYTGGDPSGGMHRLSDKRVAVVGTGASTIQCVPHLARDAAHLLVVQRTPSTVDVRDDGPTDPDWWASLEPGWQGRRRDRFLGLLNGHPADGHEDGVDDRWTDIAPVRGIARYMRTRETETLDEAMEIADAQKMDEIRARVAETVTDPATAAALQPWYRQMCKRPLFSDTYLEAFNLPTVTLLNTAGRGVERFTRDGLVVDGTEYPVDAIVFGTGFELGADPATRTGAAIRGRDGRTLAQVWSDGPTTLHGLVSRGFPNLFHVGVSQNAVSANFAHILEEQATHIAVVVAEADRRGVSTVEPTAEAEREWVATIRASSRYDPAFLAGCTPGYYNFEGSPPDRSEMFDGGPLEFHELLRRFRDGDMHEVLGGDAR